MAQKPARRHVITEIRLSIGLSQTEFAKILDVAGSTIQKIEQGTLALSEELAIKAQKVLDVSAGWLLANDWTTFAVTPRGNLWTNDFYELTQGTPPGHSWSVMHGVPVADAEKSTIAFTALQAVKINAEIRAMLEGVRGRPKQGILLHRLRETIKELQKDFPPDKKTLDECQPEIEKASNEFETLNAKITKAATSWIEGPPAKAQTKPKK